MQDYFIFSYSFDPALCSIAEGAQGITDEFNMNKGVRMGNNYPSRATFRMYEENPGLQVGDAIRNTLGYMMISDRFKNLLEQEVDDDIEFLLFELLDHKGRIAESNLFIANPIGAEDCIDLERSKYRGNKIFPDRIREIRELYLSPETLDGTKKLFRLRQRPRVILVRQDLKEAIELAGLTGIEWLHLGTRISV